jgi:dephospho-CoA kinase
LTGNIATGKSTVGKLLSQLGVEHIDADRLAHQLMARGTPVWKGIVSAFGTQILRADGTIDRGRLGSIVFSDKSALAQLEAIVHPGVIERVHQLITASTAPVVVIEAIKLIESGMVSQLCNALWVVIADVVIDNSGSVAATTRQVEQAWAGIGGTDHAQAKFIQ